MNLLLKSAHAVRQDLLDRREIALLDVREEAPHAEGHPLFAANLPYSRIELDALGRLPRNSVPIVLFDNGEGLAERSARSLIRLGYSDVQLLDGGLQGWIDAGYEIFRDVNAPSKAFGELVEAKRHTPSLSAHEVKSLLDNHEDVVVLDARKFTEYQTMSIPTAISVPGAELALRVRELAPNPNTRVIVNCAGRTRSIIGTQSLINAGIPNPVAALRNGTIGWKLAHLELDHGKARRYSGVSPGSHRAAADSARKVADAAGVLRTSLAALNQWDAEAITIYRFDVRSPEEYEDGSLAGFRNISGGQLVQETDFHAPVRNARIVLADDDGVRANMTASWLAQMAWEVFVVDGLSREDFSRKPSAPRIAPMPEMSDANLIDPATLQKWMKSGEGLIVVLDFSSSAEYAKRHIPGTWYALRSSIAEGLKTIPPTQKIVLTSQDNAVALFAWSDVATQTSAQVFVLQGGTERWVAEGFPVSSSNPRYACSPLDRYRRPYEGTNIEPEVMQAYLDWEFGLVQQLERDGTHGFHVLPAESLT